MRNPTWEVPRNRALLSNAIFAAFVGIILLISLMVPGNAAVNDSVLGFGWEWVLMFGGVSMASIMGLLGAARKRTALALASGLYAARSAGVLVGLVTSWPENWPTYAVGAALWFYLSVRNAYAAGETQPASSSFGSVKEVEEWREVRYRG